MLTFEDAVKQAQGIMAAYAINNELNERKQWSVEQYAAGLVGDVGDLTKLLMAYSGFRESPDTFTRIQHELFDCLWSVFAIADCIGVDLAQVFTQESQALLDHIQKQNDSLSRLHQP